MRYRSSIFVLALLLMPAVAGCLTQEAAVKPVLMPAPEPVVTATTGSVTGMVVSASYEPLPAANVSLYLADAAFGIATADAKGRFTFNGLPPSLYRVQATAASYLPSSLPAEVVAGVIEQANLVLDPVPVEEGYMVPDEWTGFLGCGVGVPAFSISACSDLYGEYGVDPNDDFVETFTFDPGLTEIVFGATWRGAGGFSAERLLFEVYIDLKGDPAAPQWVKYVSALGPSPVRFTVNDTIIGAKEDPVPTLASFNTTMRMQVRAYVPRDFGVPVVVYQQPFTVYWESYYGMAAPPGRDPIPDL